VCLGVCFGVFGVCVWFVCGCEIEFFWRAFVCYVCVRVWCLCFCVFVACLSVFMCLFFVVCVSLWCV